MSRKEQEQEFEKAWGEEGPIQQAVDAAGADAAFLAHAEREFGAEPTEEEKKAAEEKAKAEAAKAEGEKK
jgi:hypothetical protein